MPLSKSSRSILHFFSFSNNPYLWCLPALTIAVFTVYYPMAYSLYLSLTNYRFGMESPTFIGLENYFRALISGDFVKSLRITLTFVVGAVLIEVALGLGIALFLNTIMKGESVIKALITIPISITPVAAGLMWKWIFEPEVGILNYFLELFGQPKQLWLSNPATALWTIILTDIWKQTPFVIIVLLAALSTIPQSMYEAAIIDGAGAWARFRHITLYYIRPALFVVILSLTATAFKVYDIVYILTQGGPAGATSVLSFEIYRTGFKFSNIAYASALSFLMLLVSTSIAVIYIYIIYPKEYR